MCEPKQLDGTDAGDEREAGPPLWCQLHADALARLNSLLAALEYNCSIRCEKARAQLELF